MLQSSHNSRWKATSEPATILEVYIICYNAQCAKNSISRKNTLHPSVYICLGEDSKQEEGGCVPSSIVQYSEIKGGKLGS